LHVGNITSFPIAYIQLRQTTTSIKHIIHISNSKCIPVTCINFCHCW